MSNKGLCWIHPHPEEEWYPGEVLRKEGDTYIVQDEYGQTFKINEKVAEMVEQETLSRICLKRSWGR